jgi:ferritin-like metal-binding protein YciE
MQQEFIAMACFFIGLRDTTLKNLNFKNMKNGATKSAKAAPAKKAPAKQNNKTAAATNGRKASSNGQQAVAAKSDAAQGLSDLFEDMLKDIYWAEKALTKALPKMGKNATSPELQSALQDHLAVTQEQVSRLEQVFEILGKPARAKKCAAMEGLIKEGEEIMQETEKGMVRDAGIIAGGQKIEHYEIASYGTLVSFAKTLGEEEAAGLLEQTLNEEKEADEKLTEVAETAVNVGAMEAGDDEDEDEEEDDEDDDVDEIDEDDEDDDEPAAKSNGRATASAKKR